MSIRMLDNIQQNSKKWEKVENLREDDVHRG